MDGSQIVYKFGPFLLDADRRRLLREQEPVALAPEALETLLALIEQRHRVVTKEELLQRIWGDTTVEEGGLTRNISILRKALGERPDDHQYIVTIPGRGYRFVAGVTHTAGNAGEPDDQVLAVAAPASEPRARWRSPRWLVLAGVTSVLAGSFLAYLSGPPRTAASSRPPIAALAVLPLDNLSGDPSQEYFADGMTEALIANLARLRALRVVSRTSIMRFKNSSRSLAEISRALHVDAVIEGSVQRTGDRVRINVRLVHAPTDTHLWTRAYERALTDVLALQAEVTRVIAEEIQVQLTSEERARLAAAGSVDPAAYQQYLLGQHYLWRLNEEDLARAIEHFEHSARLSPGYAAAYAGLSHAWWWRGIWGARTRKEVEPPLRAAAARALELDPQLAEAHVSNGRIKFGYALDWADAERDFKRALEIDPNNVDAHFFSAMLCMALGCFPESIEHMKRVEQADPLSATVQSFFGRVLYRARRFDEAIAHFNRAIELAPHNPAGAYHRLAEVYEQLARCEEALAVLREGAGAEERSGIGLLTARIHARMGKREEARDTLDASRGRNPLTSATVFAALGDKDEAFRLLLQAIDEPQGLPVYMKTDPPLDSLHSDPRWSVMLRRMNFPIDETPAR